MTSSGKVLGAILHYDGAPTTGNPTSTGVTMRTSCDDEATSNLVPFVPNQVPTSIVGDAPNHKMTLNSFSNASQNNLFRWTIDGNPFVIDWNNPSLETVLAGSKNFGPNENVYTMEGANSWYLWWIQSASPIPLPHPIHLHGHDYYIVGSGPGTWDGSTAGLKFNNPTRRDTAILPAGGYLLIAFPADNPGMWIMHCHIAWHASQGLSVQFMERMSEIKGTLGDTSILKDGCDAWDGYWAEGSEPNPSRPYEQTDSGI